MSKDQEKEIKEYIERYAAQHGITIEEAKEHAIIKAYEHFKMNEV